MSLMDLLTVVNSDPKMTLDERLQYVDGCIPRGLYLKSESKNSSINLSHSSSVSSIVGDEVAVLDISSKGILDNINYVASATFGYNSSNTNYYLRPKNTSVMKVYINDELVIEKTATVSGGSKTSPTDSVSDVLVNMDLSKPYCDEVDKNYLIFFDKLKITLQITNSPEFYSSYHSGYPVSAQVATTINVSYALLNERETGL